MRKQFAKMLFEEMANNNDIYLITGDLGYGLFDDIRDTYPLRFMNVGSSEMVMMGTGIGLAMEGKIPFVYSITPFAIYRPFEMIRNYLSHEGILVNVIGGGRDQDYGYLGFSHWAEDDKSIINQLPNLATAWPETEENLKECMRYCLSRTLPTYINLKR